MGEPGTMELTVLCQDEVTEAVTITDDKGEQLAILENNGSGQLKGTVEIYEQQPRYGQLVASAGESASAPLSFHVIPEIMEEMLDRLLEVSGDLGDYVQQEEFEDPFGEEALEEIAGWLEADERVRKVEQAGEGLLFETTDSLIGSYGLSRTEPNSFGFTDADSAFEAYQAGNSTEGMFIPSRIPMTNSKILHLSPIPQDWGVSHFSEYFRQSEEKLAERIDGKLTWLEGNTAIETFAKGEFTDYGLVVLNTHGNVIEQENGDSLLLMNMGEKSRAELDEITDRLDYATADFGNFWGMLDQKGTIRWVLDVTVDGEHVKYTLHMTGNYLECALSDNVFDNTILYFIVCYARSDQKMVDLLHRHGASAIIGCRYTLDVGISVGFLEQLAEVMGQSQNAYSYGKLTDAAAPFSQDIEQLIQTVCSNEDDYNDYLAARTERPLSFSFLADCDMRAFSGWGDIEGVVLDQDLEPQEEAEVILYRWLDHGFKKVWSGETDEEGSYLAEEVPYGIYGIYAKKDKAEGFVTFVLDDGAEVQEAEDIVLDWTEAENNGGNVVRYRGDLYYWKYNGASLSDTGLFAYYPYQYQTVNQLIRRHEDGSEEVVLNGKGNGPIFIVGSRIYLEEDGANLFSVNLEGGDRVEHGTFTPWAVDDSAGVLIGTKGYDQGVWLLRAKDHTMENVCPKGYYFLGAEDGYCYFSSVDNGAAPIATLWRAAVDGSEVVALDSVTSSGDYGAMGLDICQIVKVEDMIYYSYGFYAGTGGFFQNGGINCVDVDSGSSKVCVAYGNLAAEEFLVGEENGQTLLYYIGPDDGMGSYIGYWDDYPYHGCRVKNLETGQESASDFLLTSPGAFVCMDGEIWKMGAEGTAYQLLVPKEARFFGILRMALGA